MKRFLSAVLVPMMLIFLCSCGADSAKDKNKSSEAVRNVSINVYAINNELTVISKLIVTAPFDTNYYLTSCKATMKQNRAVFPSELELKKIEIENNTAKCYFNDVIDTLDDSEKMYAAEMLALCVSQHEQISKISFFNEKGSVEGILGRPYESALVSQKDKMNIHVDLVTLFFADKNASGLIREKRVVHVKEMLAASIVEELFKGTKDKGEKVDVIPENTVLLGCTQTSDVLSINVSQAFVNGENGSDTLSIYSVVNALTELDDINYVRIVVNGDENAVLGNYSLGDVFSRKSDLILY